MPDEPNEIKSFIDESALEALLKRLQTAPEDIFPIKLMSIHGISPNRESSKLLRREITLTTNSILRAAMQGNKEMTPVIAAYLVEVGFQIGMSHCVDREVFDELKTADALEKLKP